MIVEGSTVAEVPTVRRVRRMRSHFERLVRPADVAPGEPMPSIEGWVLFLTNLPANTTTDHILDIFHTHASPTATTTTTTLNNEADENEKDNNNNNNDNDNDDEGNTATTTGAVTGGGYGRVREVKMPLDRNCECCGYALVELESREAFTRALRELNGIPLPFAEGEPRDGGEAWRLHIAPTFLGEEEEEDPMAGEKRMRE
ncbi:RNA-binding protein 8A [Trypanosoma theileri]|uniref:RNA-binding protein 8A n=1 Tax=Trypanosoma theileri TaxID=67003 RepID=A0A1X0NU33_9TRYP|nr:RNA-binding protein 8A [Trypanosoma theileri]ORC87610.1 RNA-binding protein 8A [Trypanosoma theileri]